MYIDIKKLMLILSIYIIVHAYLKPEMSFSTSLQNNVIQLGHSVTKYSTLSQYTISTLITGL